MSRQTYFLGLGIALVALAFVVTDVLVCGSPGLTKWNVRRIHQGMTAGDVEALLGEQSRVVLILEDKVLAEWPAVRAYLEDDRQRLQEFTERRTDPESRADAQAFLDYLRYQVSSKEGLRLAFLGVEGGFPVVCFGEGGRVRWAEWRRQEESSPATPLSRMRSGLGW